MYLSIFFIFIFQGIYVKGLDLNSVFPRTVCYNEQNNCGIRFIDVYPSLSKSVTNLTEAETYMLLYTRASPDPEILDRCGGNLPPNSKFNPKNEVIVIFIPFIAGYCDIAAYREWTVQLLKRGDYNIIIIDYSWAQQLDYATAVLNVQRIVRYQVLILLQNIRERIKVPFVHLTFIGHSLGAQAAGLVGAYYRTVDRIIGIDPAGPGFAKDETPLIDRLDPSDAKLVEIWHCDAGACLPFFGIDYEAGHVNFYINGGTAQPACFPYAFESILKGDLIYGFGTLILPTICWHAHCAIYFKVSINPGNCQFVGVRCDSKSDYDQGKCRNCGADGENCLIMGWDTEKYIKEIPSQPQIYFVKTSLKCPYCDKKYVSLDGYKDTYLSSLQQCKKKKITL